MGPCSSGDLTSVSPDGPPVPGDLQARPFRAEKLTVQCRGLLGAFQIAGARDEVHPIVDDVNLFAAVYGQIVKTDRTDSDGEDRDEALDTALRQLVNDAITADGVIDRALASASPVLQGQDSEPVASPSRPSALVLDVLPNDAARRRSAGCGEVRGRPEVVSVSADPVLCPELPEETPFNEFTPLESCTVGGYSTQIWTKNMDVVVLPVHLQGCTEVLAHVSEHGS